MKSITCEYTITDPGQVMLDGNIIVRVIVNLLTNAIKFSEIGGTIWINSKIQQIGTDNHLIITVKDAGPGIEEEKLPLIFNHFTQLNAKDSGKAASTGLGLTFCKLAVEAHSGVINVASVVGEGSTFIVSIPMSEGSMDEVEMDQLEMIKLVRKPHKWIREEDIDRLQQMIPVLEKLEVYEVGELKKVFENLDKEDIKSQWVIELKAAVHYADKKRYEELIQELT